MFCSLQMFFLLISTAPILEPWLNIPMLELQVTLWHQQHCCMSLLSRLLSPTTI